MEKGTIFDRETQFLIKITEDLYKKTNLPDVDIEDINIDRFIKIALKNNTLYYCAKKILQNISLNEALKYRFEEIVKKSEMELRQIDKSIKEIKSNINDYLIFKTYRGDRFPRIGNDVDVLVKNDKLKSVKKYFFSIGYNIDNDDPKEKSVGLLKNGQKRIHLQGGVTWCWQEFADEELIYDKPREALYNGQEIRIPNYEADLLIHIAHMNFEPLLIIYSELLYLFKILPRVNFNTVLEQSKKYRWHKTFLRTINIMNNFHYFLYNQVCIDNVQFKKIDFSQVKFPHDFSFKHLVQMCLEKRMLIYPLTKFFKIINLIITKDAYQYIDSPERKTVNN